jgi:hypothetical protein
MIIKYHEFINVFICLWQNFLFSKTLYIILLKYSQSVRKMITTSKQNQEKVCFKVTENLGLLERFEEIIKLVNLTNNVYRKTKTHRRVERLTTAQQVRDLKDKAIVDSILLFGRIN